MSFVHCNPNFSLDTPPCFTQASGNCVRQIVFVENDRRSSRNSSLMVGVVGSAPFEQEQSESDAATITGTNKQVRARFDSA